MVCRRYRGVSSVGVGAVEVDGCRGLGSRGSRAGSLCYARGSKLWGFLVNVGEDRRGFTLTANVGYGF